MHRGPVHILLVENCEADAALIHQALLPEAETWRLSAVPNLAAARNFLQKASPDLAIIDLQLPDGSGLELLSNGQVVPAFPAVILGELDNARTALTALRAGALDYLVKTPMLYSELPGSLQKALDDWAQSIERRRAAEALRESEQRFQTIFNNAAAGMVRISTEGRFLEVNEAFCNFIGCSRDELLQLRVVDITHPEDQQQTAENYRQLGSGKKLKINYQKRYQCKDGSVRWGHASIAAVLGRDNLPLYYIGLVQDISESKQVQDQVRKSQQMLQLVLDNIPQHVFWKDRHSVFLGCNQNFSRVAGVEKPEDLIGKTDYDLAWKKEESDFFRECDRRVMTADKAELHIIEPQLQANGKQAWLDTNKIPLHDDAGRVVGILGTFEDITERKQAEEQLIAANRELDAFVYTVSHDLRSQLTPIISYAELLQQSCRERLDQQSLHYLAEIGNQGLRMLRLMEDLLVLAKVGHVQRPAEPIDPNQVLQEVLLNLGSQLAEAHLCTKVLPLPELRIPQSLLQQIFQNLIENAIRYAGREGGPIEIGGERKDNLVQLFVRDHGPGISKAEQSRIFEVFYRGAANQMSPGTGVGLATVEKIARLYGGHAWIEQTPGGGSTFWVELLDEQD